MSEPQSENPMIKPVYIKNRELQSDRSDRITDYELYEAIRKTIGDKIYCILVASVTHVQG